MTLRRRLALTLGALLIVVGATSAWSLVLLESSRDAAEVVVEEAQPAVETVTTVVRETFDVQVDTSVYVLAPTGEQLERLEESKTRLTTAYDDLAEQTASDPQASEAVAAARSATDAWLANVIDPVVAAIGAGDTAEARQLSTAAATKQAEDSVEAALSSLQGAVGDWQSRTVVDATDSVRQLEQSLVVSLIATLVAVIAVLIGLRRWVLRPLRRFDADMQQITGGDLDHRIAEVGPPDIVETTVAAEDMRRRLVAGIDEAVASREALEQRGPVIAALRRELAPSPSPTVAGLDVAGVLVPAEGVLAGDWYDVDTTPEGRMGVLSIDVAGHGALAGLAALKLKYAMTSALRGGGGPRRAIQAAVDALDQDPERFATAVALTVTPTGEVAWCNAGHPTPLIVLRGGEIQRLAPTGPLVSWLGGSWTVGRASLPPGATLIVMSDGLLESRDDAGRELAEDWGNHEVVELVREGSDARSIADAIVLAARDRAARWRVDDVTVVVVRRT